MDKIFLHYLVIAITASIVFYLIGLLVFRIFGFKVQGAFTNFFLKQLTGIFLFTTISALYFTALRTIFLGIIFPFTGFFIWYGKYRKGKVTYKHTGFRDELLPAILFSFTVCIIFSYRFYSITYNGSIPNIPNPDFTFYSRISHFIVESGVESATPTIIFPQYNSINPYHYFDLWFNGGLSYFSRGNNLLVLFLVSYTIGISMVWLGFCSLAEQLKKITLLDTLLALMAIFFLPLQTPVSEAINLALNKFYILTHAPADYLGYGLWNLTKTYLVYLIFIAAALAFLKKEKTLVIITLSTLSLVYSTIAIPIMLTLSLYILLDYLFFSRDKQFFINSAGYLFLICVFIFCFYFSYLTGSVGTQLTPFARFGVEPLYKSILRPIKVFVDANVQLLLLYLPFIVLLILHMLNYTAFKKVPNLIYNTLCNNRYAQFVIVFHIASLASWCILFDFVDSNQFFVKTSIVMLNILCFVFVIHLRLAYLKILALLLSVYCIFITTKDIFEQRLYSEDYMMQLQEVTKDTGRIGGFLLHKADYEDGYGDNIVEVLGDYITLFRSDYYAVNLSITDLPVSQDKMESGSMRQRLEQYDFYRFMSQQRSKNKFHSVAESRLDFIDYFNVDFLIVSPHVHLDSLLQKRVRRKIVDNYSQQVFLLLGQNDH